MQPENNLPAVSNSGLQIAKNADNSLALINQLLEEGKSEYWYRKAQKAKDQKDWEAAFYFYSKAVQLDSKEELYLIPKGYCAMKLGKSEIAANSLIQAFKFRKSWFLNAFTHNDYSRMFLPQNEWNELRNHFKHLDALTYNISFTNVLLEIARNGRGTGLNILDSLSNEYKCLNPDYFDLRARINYDLEDFVSAKKDLETLISFETNNAEAYFNRGLVNENLQEFTLAIIDFSTCIELNPKYNSAYNHRADIYYKLGETQSAINDYSTLIELNPKSNSYYTYRGNTYFKLKEFALAIDDYSTIIELYPKSDNTDAYVYRGMAYYELKEFSLAIQDLTKAVKLYSKYGKAYFYRALSYEKINEFTLAIDDYTAYIELVPRFPKRAANALLNRGLNYYNLKNFPLAIQDFSKAIELDPHLTEAQSLIEKSKKELNLFKY